MTLAQLEAKLHHFALIFDLSVYELRKDEELIKLLVNDATKEELKEYLREEYPDYFED